MAQAAAQILTDKMLAIPRDHIRQLVGSMDADTRVRLDSALLIVLGLAH